MNCIISRHYLDTSHVLVLLDTLHKVREECLGGLVVLRQLSSEVVEWVSIHNVWVHKLV